MVEGAFETTEKLQTRIDLEKIVGTWMIQHVQMLSASYIGTLQYF
jgi:hypothetical protein